jgi:glycosyltransferase involved in cell wall biosynthesis
VSSLPGTVIGVPLYNGAEHLATALDSLVGQSYPNVRLALVDDCSTDRTSEIAERYAAESGGRIYFERNERRIGMIANWRKAFELACRLNPQAKYFAWGSDHDLWEPTWVSALVQELEGAPEAVLAYPLSLRISAEGEVVRKPWFFETRGIHDRRDRLARSVSGMSAGNMVYGLFRVEALRRAGVFRTVLLPDRLVLSELAVQGEFRQVREVLWQRRFVRKATHGRQRASFFPRRAPLYSYLPWWMMHTASLFERLVVRGCCRPEVSRWNGFELCLRYLGLSMRQEVVAFSRRRDQSRRYQAAARPVRIVRRGAGRLMAASRKGRASRAKPRGSG